MKNHPIRHDRHCRVCNEDRITTVFKLKPTPPEDQFIAKEKLNIIQECYALDLAICDSCGYLHLSHILHPEISYPDYIYETKVTLGLGNHYQSYADEVIALFPKSKDELVVDLGSNDGTMLKAFANRKLNVLGVEPGRAIAKTANEAGIPTINDFFSKKVVYEILKNYGKPLIITANYMYANVDDLLGFTKNVASLLKDDGVFVVQTGYHPEQMKINMFDYVYHEHFSYFTLTVLKVLFEKCGLELIDAQLLPAKGGSIRVLAQLSGGVKKISKRAIEILKSEQDSGMLRSDIYIHFAKKINSIKDQVNKTCDQLKCSGKRIVGYGASHSTTTLLYHFELFNYIDYLVDDNPIKQGLFSPGKHFPVYSSDKLTDDLPDYALILAWNYSEPIISKHNKFLDLNGKFIVPLPELKVIQK